MLKAAGHYFVQGVLPGMAEGRMAQIVAQGYGLGQVFVQAQGPGYGARYLGHFQGVGEAGAKMVAFGSDKDLGLMLQPAEGLAMNNPVAIPLEFGPHPAGFLRPLPSPAPAA